MSDPFVDTNAHEGCVLDLDIQRANKIAAVRAWRMVLAALNDDPDAGDRTLAEFGDCVHCLRNMIMSIFALTLADQLANQAGRERAVAIIEKLIADQMKG